ncbi:MAG: TPM domain-containing protein, partial [Oscillospiraceae bacterium]|nr:TPM domain-containing protein [Oscillospiraceae bacterium]
MKLLKNHTFAVIVTVLVIALSCAYAGYQSNWRLSPQRAPEAPASPPATALPPAEAPGVTQGSLSYVQDGAGVLSDGTRSRIEAGSTKLYEATGGQIAVVSVSSLNGQYADVYANALFHKLGVGDARKNNGMLLLLVPSEGKAWLVQGSGISSVFTDTVVNQYLDRYFWPEFDAGQYDKAVQNLFSRLMGWYSSYYGVSIAGYYGTSDGSFSQPASPGGAAEARGGVGFSFVIGVLIVLFL